MGRIRRTGGQQEFRNPQALRGPEYGADIEGRTDIIQENPDPRKALSLPIGKGIAGMNKIPFRGRDSHLIQQFMTQPVAETPAENRISGFPAGPGIPGPVPDLFIKIRIRSHSSEEIPQVKQIGPAPCRQLPFPILQKTDKLPHPGTFFQSIKFTNCYHYRITSCPSEV